MIFRFIQFASYLHKPSFFGNVCRCRSEQDEDSRQQRQSVIKTEEGIVTRKMPALSGSSDNSGHYFRSHMAALIRLVTEIQFLYNALRIYMWVGHRAIVFGNIRYTDFCTKKIDDSVRLERKPPPPMTTKDEFGTFCCSRDTRDSFNSIEGQKLDYLVAYRAFGSTSNKRTAHTHNHHKYNRNER